MTLEPAPHYASSDRPPRAPGSGAIATDMEDAPILQLSDSPLNVAAMPDGKLREEYLKHQVVLRLYGPLSLKRGEYVTLRWQNADGITEAISSKVPVDVELAEGERRSFKFKNSEDPTRCRDGSISREVKIVTGRLAHDE